MVGDAVRGSNFLRNLREKGSGLSSHRPPHWLRMGLPVQAGTGKGETVEQVQKKSAAGSRTRSIAFVALTVAITAVSAWVTVPLGPVPFTLQIFAVAFMVLVLRPKEAIAAITAYLVLGAVGAPVFSGMRGGIGVLAGATGGFLWGYLLGVGLAVAVRFGLKAVFARDAQTKGARAFAIDFVTGLVFLAVAYVCGWAQLMAVAAMTPAAAFAAGVAPFIVIDLAKLVAAVICARAVNAAVAHRA